MEIIPLHFSKTDFAFGFYGHRGSSLESKLNSGTFVRTKRYNASANKDRKVICPDYTKPLKHRTSIFCYILVAISASF